LKHPVQSLEITYLWLIPTWGAEKNIPLELLNEILAEDIFMGTTPSTLRADLPEETIFYKEFWQHDQQ
jgi:hypothetical protein